MTLFSNKININEGKKYDTSQVSQDGISKEELAEIEKKNKKLIDIYKALGAGDGMSSIDLAKAMDGFSKMDTSGDGKLSKKELEAGAEAFNKEHGTNIKGKDLKDFLKSIRKATKDDTKVETNKVLEKEAARVKLQNDVDVAVEKFLGDLEAKTKAREAAEAKAEAEAKAAAEAEAKAKAEDLKTPKSYTVQPNERLESILKRSLEAQGIEVNDENMAKAKEEFIQNNPKALHGPKGKEYLYAADVIKVPGNLEDKANGDEIKAKLKPADPPADPPKTEKPVPPSIARPTEETEKPVVPSFELPGFVPKDDAPEVKVPYAPPEKKDLSHDTVTDNNGKELFTRNYDKKGRLISRTVTHPNGKLGYYPLGNNSTHVYDLMGADRFTREFNNRSTSIAYINEIADKYGEAATKSFIDEYNENAKKNGTKGIKEQLFLTGTNFIDAGRLKRLGLSSQK